MLERSSQTSFTVSRNLKNSKTYFIEAKKAKIILCASTEPAMPATFDSRESVESVWTKFPEIFAKRMVSEKIQPTRFLSLIIICRITHSWQRERKDADAVPRMVHARSSFNN